MILIEKNCVAIWENCLLIIKQHISEKNFETWFKPIKSVNLEGDILTIQVPSQFFYEWLEEHYVHLLKKAVFSELGQNGRLEYSIIVDKGNEKSGSISMSLPGKKISGYKNEVLNRLESQQDVNQYEVNRYKSNLNSNYTLDNFIEGDCNRLARSAGIAIANKPGATSFNPLTVYGGVGLGKTHLIQAIGNRILAENPTKKVLYVTSERFVNHFMESIRTNGMQDFSSYYLGVDVLIIDDIQFFSGKDKTQEMFFKIFNELHQSHRQIILTSDCPVKDLKGMEERLLSRFKWGLNADMQQPDFETKMAIIQQKIEQEAVEIPQDVIEYIAQNVETNVRELEGVIIRLIAQSSLNKKEIDLDLAKQSISNIVADISLEINIDFIQKSVCDYFQIPMDDMKSKSRKKELVIPRQVGIFLAKNYTSLSLKTIGLHFGGRDHSTVIHSVESVQDMVVTDKKFKSQLLELQKKMKLKTTTH
ncbi:MAG: chromosomal replication initiator protein DnaA [Cytophagales bacterium]|nr:MAG: chromosomal replication initiator protein DnaA [Cytophagales bacterium]